MKPELKTVNICLDNDRDITLETGLLAKQAHGSCVVKMGDTMILATVVSDKNQKEGIDFLPLSVDYREKFAADGRFPGGFLKREGRPSDQEILGMRLVDRALRPLFPKNYHSETQVMIQLMSHDRSVDPHSLIGLAASTALTLSNIPFAGPISEVRVGRIENNFVINPSPEQLEFSDIDLMIGASNDSVIMVEGEMKEISEKEMIDAIKFGHEAIKTQCNAQIELLKKLAKIEKREVDEIVETEISKQVNKICYDEIYKIATQSTSKTERTNLLEQVKEKLMTNFSEEELEENTDEIIKEFYSVQKTAIRDFILNTQTRIDGRKTTEIRPIWCEVDYLPKTHGSAVFTRGETQSLTTVTLGTSLDENRLDTVTQQGAEKFYLHYNFPPFSTGEARMKFSVSRREIGHGNLAQRALKDMINETNPYTIRVVSEILESNGSSSMATVCAGTLALMDAGVDIIRPVSGIAMGLITNDDNSKYAILSDILGDEDHLGDMDFKVTGTTEGITACQMDMKVKGLPYNILEEALNQSKEGRLHILNEMLQTMSTSRTEPKPHSPKMITITIPKNMIGGVIGPGGKVIQKMQEETETTITINEEDNVGIVEILGTNAEGIEKAQETIKDICFIPEVGETYDGIVKSIQPYGAFVEIKKGTDGLLHISEIEWKRLDKVEEVLKEGDEVKVKLISIDQKTGKLKLSRKILLPKPE